MNRQAKAEVVTVIPHVLELSRITLAWLPLLIIAPICRQLAFLQVSMAPSKVVEKFEAQAADGLLGWVKIRFCAGEGDVDECVQGLIESFLDQLETRSESFTTKLESAQRFAAESLSNLVAAVERLPKVQAASHE